MELSDIFSSISKESRRLESEIYPQIIYFRKSADAYGYLSNFYHARMIIDGKSYFHVEGYYQSQKFVGINDTVAEEIRTTYNPMICKKIAHRNHISSQQLYDWDNGRKQTVMRRGLLCKFLSDTQLLTNLLSTDNIILVEDTPWDSYWGCGPDKNGINMLGRTLMEIRSIFRNMNF